MHGEPKSVLVLSNKFKSMKHSVHNTSVTLDFRELQAWSKLRGFDVFEAVFKDKNCEWRELGEVTLPPRGEAANCSCLEELQV